MLSNENAKFIERLACINCGGLSLFEISSGRFDEGAVKKFIDADPWGEHPAPFLLGKPWSYIACNDCKTAFHRYILSPEWNERRFSKWMSQAAIEEFEKSSKTPESEFSRGTNYAAHVSRLERLTRSVRGKSAPRVLDFGCGYGGFLTMCSLHGFDAVGIDRSSAKRDNGRFTNVFAEIEDVSNGAQFHALTLFEVLEHLDDPRGVLLNLRELLVVGGILILETPDCTGVNGIETRSDYYKIHPLEHINGFTPSTLELFASNLGFVNVEKPCSFVTSNYLEVCKNVAKQLISPLRQKTTQLYFRKQ
jgi:SAM-dependent methyltransferase